MAYADYQASVGVVSYHVSGGNYALGFDTTDVRTPSGGDLKEKQQSISGVQETNYFGAVRVWGITTVPIQRASALALVLYEFLRSTADGQTFIFDPYGRPGAAVMPLTVIRDDDGYSEEKYSEIDGPNDYVKLSFSVREA